MAATPRDPMLMSVFETGGSLFGLPLVNTAEVIPCPEQLSPVPGARAGVLGLFMLRDANIPLVDVHGLAGSAAEDGGRIILVASAEGKLAGLKVGALHGMAEIDAAEMQPHAGQSESPRLFRHSFRYEGRIGYLLDADVLFALPGIPSAMRQNAGARQGAASAGDPRLFFRAGSLRFGVLATAVEATVPESPIAESPLTSALCHGTIAYLDQVISVVDPLVLMGFRAQRSPRALTSAIILRVPPSGTIALAVDEITEFAIAAESFPPPPQLAGGIDGGLFSRIVKLASGAQHILLDEHALSSRDQIASLSRLSFRKPDSAQRSRTAREGEQAARNASEDSFLFFRAGRRFAAALGQIKRIILEPPDTIFFPGSPRGLLGYFTVDGESAILVDLAGLLGLERSEAQGDTRVLLVDRLPVQLGFRVEELIAVERSLLQSAGGSAAPPAVTSCLPPNLTVPLPLATGTDLIEFIDLKQLALEYVLAPANDDQAREPEAHAQTA